MANTSAENPALLDGHILVVDDDPDILFTIQWALEDEGFRVRTAADGREAVQLGIESRPSLLVLDMGLPIMTGERVAARLREVYGSEVPILVITADGHAAEKARRVGAVAFLSKPFDVDALVKSVQQSVT